MDTTIYSALDNIAGVGRWEINIDGSMNLPEGITKVMIDTEMARLKRVNYGTEIQEAVQSHVDALAQSKRYDNMMSVRSYTGFPNKFQRECMSMSIWAGDCWAVVTDIEVAVMLGQRAIPTVQEVLKELPKYLGRE